MEVLVRLINVAFSVERIAFDGERIDAPGVSELMNRGAFLLAEDAEAQIGCVYVEVQDDRSYLGLLSVTPARQGTGLGRQLARAAEDYSRNAKCHTMDLRIISPRAEELLPFYRHLGYAQTGTAPFSSHKTPKVPCHYIKMEKRLT
jgi:GNAT superfamily N-acetyltransferase